MSPVHHAVGLIGNVLDLALVAVLVARGHWRDSPFFTLFVAGVFMIHAPITIWPERFYTWQFWLLQEAVLAALRFGAVLELGHRIFRSFPGAAATALNAVLAALIITAVTVVSIASPDADYREITGVIVPRIAHGTAWILTLLATAALWYRVPLAPLQRGILIGWTPYLLVFTVSRSLVEEWAWYLPMRDFLTTVDVVAWECLLAFWLWVAWAAQPASAPGVATRVMTSRSLAGRPA